MTIRIETDYPISISTDQSVSIKSEGGVTTMTIEAEAPRAPSGLVEARKPSNPAEDVLPRTRPPRSDKPRCAKIMARSGEPCARVEGHNGVCMNATQVARKQAYNKRRAKERYADDPDYAERIRANVRASYQKREDAE